MVQCADCGNTHYLCRCGSWDESKYTYVCGKHHRHKGRMYAPYSKSPAPAEAVLQAIQAVVQTAQADREAFIAHLTAKQSGQLKKELTAKRKELEQARKRLAEVDNPIAATFREAGNRHTHGRAIPAAKRAVSGGAGNLKSTGFLF
ncbi:MAG: hypothetical protein ACLR23_21925 [Clostridia bacterium]